QQHEQRYQHLVLLKHHSNQLFPYSLQIMFQRLLVGIKYFPGLASFKLTHYPGLLELIDNTTRTVIAKLKFTLNQRSGSLLMKHNQTRSIFKQRIAVAFIK